jgi:hypothetical protein
MYIRYINIVQLDNDLLMVSFSSSVNYVEFILTVITELKCRSLENTSFKLQIGKS